MAKQVERRHDLAAQASIASLAQGLGRPLAANSGRRGTLQVEQIAAVDPWWSSTRCGAASSTHSAIGQPATVREL